MQTLKPDTRKRILSVSKKLFLQHGYRDTTTRDIAREAGVGLSNLYHYYASKDELFTQLLKPATNALEELLDERHGHAGYDISTIQALRLKPQNRISFMVISYISIRIS